MLTSTGTSSITVSVDNMRVEHYSRNPKIMRVLKTMKLMETKGSIPTAEGVELLGESMAITRSLLNDLVEGGAIRAKGQTRARQYHPTQF